MKSSVLKYAAAALMVACHALPATAGNKTMVSPNGVGKVESSVNYSILTEAKNPSEGVSGTATATRPAAGVNPPAGFTGVSVPLPANCPKTNYCTVTTAYVTGGYKAVVRSYVTGGATADNAELDQKIQTDPVECAHYDVEAITEILGPNSGHLLVTGEASAGTAVWFRAFEFAAPDPNNVTREDVIAGGTLKYEVLIPGPFGYEAGCPLRSQFTFGGDTNKLYIMTDAVAKSVAFTVTCPENVVFGCNEPVVYPLPTVSGGCGNIMASYYPPTNSLSVGNNTVTITAFDQVGNTNACTFTVTILDTNAPVAPVLNTVTGQCSASVTAPTATDNCAGTVTGTTIDPLNYTTQGTYTVHWTFNDGNGNSSTANQTVVVQDTMPPVTPVLETVTGQCSASVTAPTTTDNCGGTVTGTTIDPMTYAIQGTYTVRWTFNDGRGNSTTANQTVMVKDTIPPVTPVLPNLTGACGAAVTVPVPTTTDLCAGTVTGTTSDPLVYSAPGTNIVRWSFRDGNGNSTTANQTVIVTSLTFKGFYSPIGKVGNTCSTAVCAEWGRTIPIKFDMLCGTSYITGGQPPIITIQKMTSSCQPVGAPVIVNAVYNNYWHYNWNTDRCSRGEIYKLTVVLPDGTSRYVFVKPKRDD